MCPRPVLVPILVPTPTPCHVGRPRRTPTHPGPFLSPYQRHIAPQLVLVHPWAVSIFVPYQAGCPHSSSMQHLSSKTDSNTLNLVSILSGIQSFDFTVILKLTVSKESLNYLMPKLPTTLRITLIHYKFF